MVNKQYWKLDANEMRSLYAKKVLSTSAYVLGIVKLNRSAGWKWSLKPEEFCQEWGIPRRSFYKAVSDLKHLGLLHWEVKGEVIVWWGFDKEDSDSEPVQDVAQPVQDVAQPVQDVAQPVQDVALATAAMLTQQQSCNSNNSLTDLLTTSLTSLPPTPLKGGEEREKKFGFEISKGEEAKDCSTLSEPKTEIAIPTDRLSVRQATPARVDPFFQKHHDPSVVVWNWLPDGPWKTEDGKLDPNFQTELARRWVEEHGGDLHAKKANVLKHFKNDPTNLPIEWEWYQGKYLHVVANVQLRKLGGIDTTVDEQKVIKHANAFKQLPEELRVTPSQSAQQLIAEVASHALPVVQVATNALPEGAESPESYRVFAASDDYWANLKHPQPKKEPEPVSEDEKAKAIAAIEELKKRNQERCNRGKGRLTKVEDIAKLPKEDFNTMLEDMRKYLTSGSDVCRQIAIDWASDPKNGCELIKRNGRVVDICEMEF